MGKRAPSSKRVAIPPPASSDQSDASDSGPNSMSDFQVLINALQTKFTKKARDQQSHFEAELKQTVEKTVEVLSSKVSDYEQHLSGQLSKLEADLGKIGKEREMQVSSFERQYSAMKLSVEECLRTLSQLDDEYNEKIKKFFKVMNADRETAAQSKESISKIAESVQEVTHAAKKRRK